MTPELRDQYERAAVELENGRIPKSGVELQACDVLAKRRHIGMLTPVEMIQLCKDAARLLRECVAKGETLP